jgi:hypothetical protein
MNIELSVGTRWKRGIFLPDLISPPVLGITSISFLGSINISLIVHCKASRYREESPVT